LPRLLSYSGMNRRSLLRLLGLSVVGLAGCASDGSDRGGPPTRPAPAEPTPDHSATPISGPERVVDALQPSITGIQLVETDDGHPRAIVPVQNTGEESADAVLAVTIEGSGEEYTTRTDISVPAGESREYSLTFDVAWSTVAADSEPSISEIVPLNPEYLS
jgi:hypothetical protein